MVQAGKGFGLKHCGYYAMRAVRIEKFYAFWGQVRTLNSLLKQFMCFDYMSKIEVQFGHLFTSKDWKVINLICLKGMIINGIIIRD